MRPSSAPTDLALPPASRLAHAAPVQVPVPSTPSPTQSALVDIKRAQLASTNALERKLDVEEPRIQEVRGHVACCALGRRGQRGRRLGLRRTPEAGCGLTTLLDATGARGRLGQWSKISRGWEGGGCDSSAACCDLAWKSLSHVVEVSLTHVGSLTRACLTDDPAILLAPSSLVRPAPGVGGTGCDSLDVCRGALLFFPKILRIALFLPLRGASQALTYGLFS